MRLLGLPQAVIRDKKNMHDCRQQWQEVTMINTTLIGPAPPFGDGDIVGNTDIAMGDARAF
jgi:hypothetical protein